MHAFRYTGSLLGLSVVSRLFRLYTSLLGGRVVLLVFTILPLGNVLRRAVRTAAIAVVGNIEATALKHDPNR